MHPMQTKVQGRAKSERQKWEAKAKSENQCKKNTLNQNKSQQDARANEMWEQSERQKWETKGKNEI
jgi:hypothetical protein